MSDLKLKSKLLRAGKSWKQVGMIQLSLTSRHEELTYLNDLRTTSMVLRPILLLEEFTGALLVGIGMMALIVNVLIGGSLLLQGPGFVIELLAK